MLAARFPFLLSLALLTEYREVLLRRRVRERHGLSAAEIDRILTEIALNGIVVEPQDSSSSAPDAGDQYLRDLLSARPDAILVTGDAALADRPPTGVNAVSPAVFVE